MNPIKLWWFNLFVFFFIYIFLLHVLLSILLNLYFHFLIFWIMVFHLTNIRRKWNINIWSGNYIKKKIQSFKLYKMKFSIILLKKICMVYYNTIQVYQYIKKKKIRVVTYNLELSWNDNIDSKINEREYFFRL